MRLFLGLCIQTFYGHHNSINSIKFNDNNDNEISTCDSDGIVKIWDIRTIKEKLSIDVNKLRRSCNDTLFDQSGQRIITANDDNTIKIFNNITNELNNQECKLLQTLNGHNDSINCLIFSHNSNSLLSSSNDATVRVWSQM